MLLGFYDSAEDAAEAIRQLRRKRYRRVALIRKSPEGRVTTDKISSRLGLWWGMAGGLALGALLGLLMMPVMEFFTRVEGYVALVLSAVAGGLGGWLLLRWLGLDLDDEPVRKLGQRLVADESMLIVQAPALWLGPAIALLRGVGDSQPAVFALRPGFEAGPEAALVRTEPLTTARLIDHARQLAWGHRVEPRGEGPRRRTGAKAPLLNRLAEGEQIIERVRRELAEASRLEQTISPSAEWILDNAYIVQGQINDVRTNLPKPFYHELPVLVSDPMRGDPRVYALASELIGHTDCRLDADNIDAFLSAYQLVAPLTMGELWALPMMLRIGIIDSLRQLAEQTGRRLREREYADLWANRLLAAARRDPNQLLFILAELAHEVPQPGAYFAFQLTGHLYDAEAALVPVQNWLERKLGASVPQIILDEQARQAADQVSIAHAITSLRTLMLLDWRDIFEAHSRVERVLREDPSGVYAQMDFATRDSYRHAVEQISRASRLDEEDVARRAIEHARSGGTGTAAQNPGPEVLDPESAISDSPSRWNRDEATAIDLGAPDEATPIEPPLGRELGAERHRRHVGYPLIGEGRPAFVHLINGCESRGCRMLRWVRAHPTGLYLGSIAAATSAAVAAAVALTAAVGAPPWMLAVMALAAALPASELAVQIVNYALTRLLGPATLAKMDFTKSGIPDEFRTLIEKMRGAQ